jgi:sugar phosphate isomerase/epimerase
LTISDHRHPSAQPILSLHCASLQGTTLIDDLECASQAGFDGVELWWPKVCDFFRRGGSIDELTHLLGRLKVSMLNVLMPVETRDPAQRAAVLRQSEKMAMFAARVDCPAIQAVVLDDLTPGNWILQRSEILDALENIVDRVWAYGVRIALEPVSFSPFCTLPQAIEIIDVLGRERVGLVLDTWHLWTAGISPGLVAEVDEQLVDAVQISDATPRSGPVWTDADRAVLPGDGLIPLDDLVIAVAQTGYSGPWSCETLGLGNCDPFELAKNLHRRLSAHMTTAGLGPRSRR